MIDFNRDLAPRLCHGNSIKHALRAWTRHGHSARRPLLPSNGAATPTADNQRRGTRAGHRGQDLPRAIGRSRRDRLIEVCVTLRWSKRDSNYRSVS